MFFKFIGEKILTIFINISFISKVHFLRKTKLESEEICAELVHSFLLPEILKIEARKKSLLFFLFFFE